MNYTQFGFSTAAASIVIGAFFVNVFEKYVPFIGEAFRYGKFGVTEKSTLICNLLLDFPKSYFKHFYCVAVICFTYGLYQATNVYIFGNDVPQHIFNFLDAVTQEDRKSNITATSVYIALCLMTLQVYRRFHDTHFVSVFGKNSRINIIHYALGMLHYPGAAIALFSEAPKFSNNTVYASNDINLLKLTVLDCLAIALFLWAWWHQYTTSKILADLRKNKNGEVITNEHKLPFGDWFEYLSSPPQVAEILMYTSITLILYKNTTWWYVYMWVIVNQVECSLLSHWWYEKTFKNFPKNRKALIPFIY